MRLHILTSALLVALAAGTLFVAAEVSIDAVNGFRLDELISLWASDVSLPFIRAFVVLKRITSPDARPVSAPVVLSIKPSTWATAGGTSVSISGIYFTGATAVTIGGAAATNVVVVDDTTIAAVAPAGTAGPASVLVTTPRGTNAANSLFVYGGLPDISQLPTVAQLPDPFLLNNGSRVASESDWLTRRAELKEAFSSYVYGHVPPPSASLITVASQEADVVTGNYIKRSVHLKVGTGVGLTFTFNMYIPVSQSGPFANGVPGNGPYPILVTCEMSYSPLDATPNATYNASLGVAGIQELVGRGYILAEFGRDDIALDYPDFNSPIIFNSPIFSLYPRSGAMYDWGTLSAWAWGFSRVVDYLETLSYVDKSKISITGHSRGGKASLIAGAFDERIALTVTNSSNSAGGSPYRYTHAGTPTGVYPTRFPSATIDQDISYGGTPGWFVTYFRNFGGRNLNKLPLDSNSLISLIAPRAFLCTVGTLDTWGDPQGVGQAYLAAQEVWIALGAASKIGIYVATDGASDPTPGHDMLIDRFRAMLNFADSVFFGITHSYNYTTLPSAAPMSSGLPKAYTWSTPNLVPLPTVASITPNTGTTAGGVPITIAGTNFTAATTVTLGGATATNVVVVNDSSVTAVTPPHAAGRASVLVTTPRGTSVTNTIFTYTH